MDQEMIVNVLIKEGDGEAREIGILVGPRLSVEDVEREGPVQVRLMQSDKPDSPDREVTLKVLKDSGLPDGESFLNEFADTAFTLVKLGTNYPDLVGKKGSQFFVEARWNNNRKYTFVLPPCLFTRLNSKEEVFDEGQN